MNENCAGAFNFFTGGGVSVVINAVDENDFCAVTFGGLDLEMGAVLGTKILALILLAWEPRATPWA